jgi:serine/threonine protein kinase
MPHDPDLLSIGGYEILGLLARSCDCAVYRARMPMGRVVALKVLTPGPSTPPGAVEHFLAEAQLLARLSHPNIVPIYDVGRERDSGRHFCAMKLIEGHDLHHHLADFVHDPCASAWLLAAVTRAVHRVHERGFLHRDLKPTHILLDAESQPYLIGFSLAVPLTSAPRPGLAVELVGTPAYMAPEQLRAQVPLTPATDVHALGVILYELLTGRRPFQGSTMVELFQQLLEHEPQRPSTVHPEVDSELEAVCLKCLAKDPPRRYGTAAALADDLERWLRGEPVLAGT